MTVVTSTNGARDGKTVHLFGQTLKQLRLDRQMSQKTLATRAKVSPGYVGLIEIGERGGRPSLDIVKRFGQAVEASVEEMEALLRTSGHLAEGESLIPDGRLTFAEFVATEPLLSKTQKDVLVRIYESWVTS